MLRRVTGALFEEDENATVELVVVATNNNGVEFATFEYDSSPLTPRSFQGHPAGEFDVQPGIHQFEVMVVFHEPPPPGARYDLFQVNPAGGLTPLGESVTADASSPSIGFEIDGVPVPVLVGDAPRGSREPAAAPSPRPGGLPSGRPRPDETPALPAAKKRKAAKRKPVKKATAKKKAATKRSARSVRTAKATRAGKKTRGATKKAAAPRRTRKKAAKGSRRGRS